jgi:hemerythrin-like domain-containing protein
MDDAVGQFKKGDWTAAHEFVKTAREYINLLNQHIYKENNVLFPLAEKHLSKEELARLSEGFELIETKKIGIGRHDEFHKMLNNLESTYLT